MQVESPTGPPCLDEPPNNDTRDSSTPELEEPPPNNETRESSTSVLKSALDAASGRAAIKARFKPGRRGGKSTEEAADASPPPSEPDKPDFESESVPEVSESEFDTSPVFFAVLEYAKGGSGGLRSKVTGERLELPSDPEEEEEPS